MSWGGWLDSSGKGIRPDGTCKEIADHIIKNDTIRCKFSEQTGMTTHRERIGGKVKKFKTVDAPTVTARSNKLEVSVSASKHPRFVIVEAPI